MEAGNEAQRKTTMKLLAVAQSQFVFLELGFALFSTAVAMGVSLYRYSGGHMTPGEVVAVILLSLEFSRTLLLIGEFFFAGAMGREVAAKVVEFFNEKAPVTSTADAHPGRTDGRPVRIEFRGVSFTYPGADQPALRNLSFSLEPHETVALIGRSGSGKTTVTNLLLRTLEPDSGGILFDGVTEKELSLDWIREQIALVPQDPFLFYGTIADNLRVAKADDDRNGARRRRRPPGSTTSSARRPTARHPRGRPGHGAERRPGTAPRHRPRVSQGRPDRGSRRTDLADRRRDRDAAQSRAGPPHGEQDRLLIAHRLSTIEQADASSPTEDGQLVEAAARAGSCSNGTASTPA